MSGFAPTFEQARAAFEAAWRDYLPNCTEADFTAFRRHRAMTVRKCAMWDAGLKLPTQVPDGSARYFCGAGIGIDCEKHVYASHTETTDDCQHA